MIFDKFGEKVLMQFYKILYRLVYQLRLMQASIHPSTAAKHPKKYFKIICQAKNVSDLLPLEKMASQIKIEEKKKQLDGGSIDAFISGKEVAHE